jgi:hypothetical protein
MNTFMTSSIPIMYDVYMTREVDSSFQWLSEPFSTKDVCSTSKNPQSNAICGFRHQTIGNVI